MKKYFIGFIIICLIISIFSVLSFSANNAFVIEDQVNFNYYTKSIVIQNEDSTEEDIVLSFDNVFRGKEDIVVSTKSTLLTLTNPDFTNEIKQNTTFLGKGIFAVKGIAEEKNILISMFVYDLVLDEFVPLYNENNNNTWFIKEESFGLFTTKDVELVKNENKIKVVAYKNTTRKNLIYGEDIQVTYFNLNIIKKDIIKEKLDSFFNNLFKDLLFKDFSDNF